jgi:hypothetical protein
MKITVIGTKNARFAPIKAVMEARDASIETAGRVIMVCSSFSPLSGGATLLSRAAAARDR